LTFLVGLYGAGPKESNSTLNSSTSYVYICIGPRAQPLATSRSERSVLQLSAMCNCEETPMNIHGYEIKAFADLRNADLYDADLHKADLYGANLHEADLHGANLRYADLQRADLQNADLRNVDLWDADLHGADLRDANLRGADLHGANLRNADLHGVDLHGADLHGADLRGADLDYSCWPLWCGSKGAKLDSEQIDQLCLHLYWVAGTTIGSIEERAQRAATKRHVQL